jgi:hypothetical protein
MARKVSKAKPEREERRIERSAPKPSIPDILTVSGRSETDVAALLRAALAADPSSRKGKAALRAAESAALRLARDFKRQALAHGGTLGADLGRRANESYFRAVLAKQLPQLLELLRRPHPLPVEPAPPPPALPAATPSKPTNVTAEPGMLSAQVHWQQATGEVVTNFKVTPHVAGAPQPATIVAGTVRDTTVLGLQAGTVYEFSVRAVALLAESAESDLSDPVAPLGPPTLPTGGGPLDLPLPAFSSDPALLIDQAAEPLRAYVADAARIGQKWRYEHLKIQALAAAREAMQYEEHIARLMAMAVDKLGTAETILNATLLQAVASGQTIAGGLAGAAASPELDSLLDPLGDTAAQSLLLPRFFAWLIETGPINFWIGLFEAIICDLASVVPLFGAMDFGRTKKYLKNAFGSDLDGIQSALQDAANDILSRLDSEIAQMVAPLRAATGQVIEGTRKAMADVFEGFDITLLMTPAKVPGQPDVPDLDPLADLYEQLDAQVNLLADQVKARVTTALLPLTQLTEGGGKLFETIVITFLALPILAFLVISLAGGPFSAALLAAAVLLAAEELLRLLVQWLAGPLLKKIGELSQHLTELVGKLQGFFALQASLVEINNPETILRILASELRQLRDFLPQAFLEEAAGVLQEARNVVLRTATQLGLAAEQALGAESSTAFEAIHDDYATHLMQAAQLPGGTDPSRLAGAALLRDFGRLEEQRTAIRDGKEIEFTHRLSLLRLLGGASLQQLIQRRELLVSLTERDLLDRMFPGVYRAVIKDVRVTGIVGGTLDARLAGIPVTLTHLGVSRTRIKRSANPSAPPLELPDRFPKTPALFSRAVLGPALFHLFPDPFPFPGGNQGIILAPLSPFFDALRAQIRRAFDTVPLFKVREYLIAFFVMIFFFNMTFDEVAEVLCRPFRQALLAQLPESLERAAIEKSCGLVDPASLVAAALSLLASKGLDFNNAVVATLLQPGSNNNLDVLPDLSPAIVVLADRLRAGFTSGGVKLPGLVEVAQEAWKQGRAAFLRRVARWGDVDLEEDPDPQVRALGFVRLVRRAPSETMVYNLFPASPATERRAESASGVSDGSPFVPASSLQYRPFENRGLEGDLLLRLESLDDDALLPLGAGGVLAQLSASLTDIVLDVTVRGCYDADLAQTVRAGRRQTASAFNIVSRLPGVLGPVGLPDSLVRVEAGASELRTVRYSLRAHRDQTLQALNAAVLALPTPPAALLSLITGKSVLGRDVAFESLDPAITSFSLELSSAPLPNTVASLQGLVGTLRVAPQDLGFDPQLLTGLNVAEPAKLVSLGIAVIPMPEGVRPVVESDDDPATLDDPMNVELQVTGLLGNVLPGFATTTPLPQRLKMTIPQEADPPTVADLFAAPTAPKLTFGLAGALADGSRLYDVLVSLTFRVPALRVRTAINALR